MIYFIGALVFIGVLVLFFHVFVELNSIEKKVLDVSGSLKKHFGKTSKTE